MPKNYEAETITFAVLFAILLAVCTAVGVELLYQRAGYSQYSVV